MVIIELPRIAIEDRHVVSIACIHVQDVFAPFSANFHHRYLYLCLRAMLLQYPNAFALRI